MTRILKGLVAVCFATALLVAQTGTRGNIQGTIKDATGAVVPGASVSATHIATSQNYEATANSAGIYVLPSMQMGKYRLTIAAAGFESWQGQLDLQTAQAAVVDAVLTVGGTSTQITVAGDITPLVTTSSGTLATTLERSRIEQLPIPERWISEVMLKVVPGMEGNFGSPRVYGVRGGGMQLSIDGSQSFNSIESENGIPPAMDSMEEFRVETNNSSAKMNAPATAIFTTKGGTNGVHGSIFETNNSTFGQARKREDSWSNPPHTVRNDFGASLGGPVYIPKVYNGKNRTFFFFAWEASRLFMGGTNNTAVPTMGMRQGDFNGLVNGAGQAITIYDPWTTNSTTYSRTPFPNNQIPSTRANALGKYLYGITPEPTLPGVNPLVAANWFGPVRTIRPEHHENVRVDHRIGERDQIFGRFSNQRRLIGEAAGNGVPVVGGVAEGYITNYKFNVYNEDSGVFSWTHTFSPTFFSEFNANGFQEDYSFHVGDPYTNYAGQLGLPNPFNKTGFPAISNPGLAGAGMSFAAPSQRGGLGRFFNFDENLTKIHGRHTLQFGGRYHFERIDDIPNQAQTTGNHQFGSMATALYDSTSSTSTAPVAMPLTGSALANQYMGIVESYALNYMRSQFLWRSEQMALYFQDDFKVNSRLTLNLGVRWEYNPPMKEADNFLTGFDLKNHAVVNGMPLSEMVARGFTLQPIADAYSKLGVKYETTQEAGLPSRFVKPNYLDFGPRVGFAYRLSDSSRAPVLRGGYSIFGFNVPTFTYEAQMRQNNPTFAGLQYSPNGAAWSPDGVPNYYLRSVPTVFAGQNTANILAVNTNSITRGNFTTTFFDPDLPTSRSHQWNLTLEKQIMADTVARVSYTGTHGSRLDQYWSLNPATSGYVWAAKTGTAPITSGTYAATAMRVYDQTTFGDLLQWRHTGWSNDNAFTFEVRRQSRGYSYQLFYVMQNAFSAAVGDNNDDYGITNKMMTPAEIYLPGVPAEDNARNRLLNYSRDITMAKHRVQWNWLADLPFGRGKLIGRNSNGIVDKLIGGWQIAGFGSVRSNYFQVPAGNWGNLGKMEVYGTKYPIQDCRSGQCISGYLWWNGYIPANKINQPNGVMGVPSDYKPFATPLIPTPATPVANDPNKPYYETNRIGVPLSNGTVQIFNSPAGLNPFRNQYVTAPLTWSLDGSLFKSVPIKERVNLRLNIDFFNVLNMPGLPGPNGDGTLLTNVSAWTNNPRHVQLSVRLTW